MPYMRVHVYARMRVPVSNDEAGFARAPEQDLWKKETDVKNLKSRIDDYEKEQQTSSELQQDKQYNIKRILQKLDFIKSNLSQSESTLKQKKDVQEEAVRNIDAYAKGQSSVEDAKEGLKQQINEAE